MEVVKHETCEQYFNRRITEGWKCIKLEGYKAILRSPGGILRPLDLRGDIETLRPNAAGDETNIDAQYPDSGAHWDKVDEATADDDSTYIYYHSSEGAYERDLYNLPASSGSGTINKITVYFRAYRYGEHAKASIKSDSVVTDGTEVTLSSDYTTYSQEWTTNPADDAAWEWTDIDALQVGVSLKGGFDPPDNYYDAYCTQVYVEVDYTPSAPTFIPRIIII